MLPSVPTPQNVPQITIVLSKLNKASHDKTGGRQSALKKGLITNLYSLLLGAQMSYRMRRNAKNNHFPSCKNPRYFSLASWQFYMFDRCLNIYWLKKCEKSRQIINGMGRIIHLLNSSTENASCFTRFRKESP